MWHKVHPFAFRLPYIKNWTATWFSDDKKSYTNNLINDNKIREYLKKSIKWLPIWDIIISRDQFEIIVTVFTARSSLLLWKDWENLAWFETKLQKITWNKVKLIVKDIKNPELNAKIVWFMIVNQIEKRMPYKRAIKQAISKTMEKWAKWIKVKVWWRLNWAEIARKETFKEWNIPNQTIRSDIDYISTRAETVYWTIWIKVWIYKGDIFKK